MKFSTTFILISFVLARSTVSLPLTQLNGDELAERDVNLDSREFSVHEDRSYLDTDTELVERDSLEERARPKKSSTSNVQPVKTKPSPSKSPLSSNTAAPSTASNTKASISTTKPSSSQTTSSRSAQPTKPAAKCAAKNKLSGGKKTSLKSRNTGQVLNIGGTSYTLGAEMQGEKAKTYSVVGGQYFAKRPTSQTWNKPFEAEVAQTKLASDTLKSTPRLYVGSGVDAGDGYLWLITAAQGVELSDRWENNKVKYATRAACEQELQAAKGLVRVEQQKLLTGARFVHADSHPGNWRVDLTADITQVRAIDFGSVSETSTVDIETNKFRYSDATWATFAGCGYCK